MPHVQRDGVKLAYEDAGGGDPGLLLVHGWCCNRTYFAPQAERFSGDQRVVSVDLRGHGDSDKPEDGYTIDGFADDLAFLCGEIGLERPVAVGHSMGGIAVLALAARHPDAVSGIVMVDPAPILRSAETEQVFTTLAGVLQEQGPAGAMALMQQFLFVDQDPGDEKARIVAEMSSAPKHVAAGAMQAIADFDGPAVLKACTAPALVIWAGDPPPDMDAHRALCPQLQQAETVGAGHFHQLFVPEQVNAMIARFLEVSVPTVSAAR